MAFFAPGGSSDVMAVALAGTVQTRSLFGQAAKDVPLSESPHAHHSSRADDAALTANVAVPGTLGDPVSDVSVTDACSVAPIANTARPATMNLLFMLNILSKIFIRRVSYHMPPRS